MKRRLLPLLLLIAALSLTACQTDGFYRGAVLLNGEHELSNDDALKGDLIMLGGELTVAEGAEISGSVYMLDGWLEIEGTVGGDLMQFDGLINLGAAASVGGMVRSAGGQFVRSPGTEIQGEVNTQPIDFSGWRQQRTPVQWITSLLFQMLFMAGLTMLSLRLFPMPVERVEDALRRYPHVCAAVGVLAFVVFPVLIVMMAFTVVLIPVSLIGLLVAVGVLAYAGLAYGRLAGALLNHLLRQRLSPGAADVLGTAIFVLLVNLVELVPIVGSPILLLTISVGAGAILLTRFGFVAFQSRAAEGLDQIGV